MFSYLNLGYKAEKRLWLQTSFVLFKPEHASLIFTVCFRHERDGLLRCYSLRDGGWYLSRQYIVYICSKDDASITSAHQRNLRTQNPTLVFAFLSVKHHLLKSKQPGISVPTQHSPHNPVRSQATAR